MDPLRIAIRCFAAFLFLLAMVRLSGKQVISQATPFDFVFTLILGDLVDDLLFSEVPAVQFVVAAGTLVILDLLVKLGCAVNDRFYHLIDGRPTILTANGTVQTKRLEAEQLSQKDYLSLLRLKGFDEQTQKELRLAILEITGEPSTLRKTGNKTAQTKDKQKLLKRGAS